MSLLQEKFGLSEFRIGQREIIDSVLSGKDVVAVLPTGGGKSLCYQYPAIDLDKLVIVVSPLIALMNDQVAGLKRRGIPAGYLHSAQSVEEKREVFAALKKPGPFVLYMSPERTQKDGFFAWLKAQENVGLFAVDEAHCVSQWGHDFRSEYAQLKTLKEIKPEVPVLALTASATPFVLSDIEKQLQLRDPVRHVYGFYRPNLYYQVETCKDQEEKAEILKQALRQNPTGRVIVYCGTRKSTEGLAQHLSKEFEGVASYHAGMSSENRHDIQTAYAEGKTRILVATNAFGMGIDHPNVRLVVHFQMPGNIDALYQEMGRAGRDGDPSTCLLLYAKKDKGLQSFFITESDAPQRIKATRWKALDNLVAYAEGGECRHAEILTYYQDAQRIERCGHCDVCDPKAAIRIVRPEKAEKGALRKVKNGYVRQDKKGNEALVLDPEQQRIFEILRLWRKEKAQELDVPAFVIFSDRTLRHLAVDRPKQLEDLAKIYGLGENKVERFGSELLNGPLAD